MNLQDSPHNYARKDTSLSTDTDDHTPTSASATLVPSSRRRGLRTVVKLTPKSLTVGADCAGMGSGIEAVLRVCPSANIVFASEEDDETRAHLINNFYIGDQMSDVSSRPARFDQHVDLHICGFPCQPYSSAGLRLGLDDERASIVHRIVDYLKKARPMHYCSKKFAGFSVQTMVKPSTRSFSMT